MSNSTVNKETKKTFVEALKGTPPHLQPKAKKVETFKIPLKAKTQRRFQGYTGLEKASTSRQERESEPPSKRIKLSDDNNRKVRDLREQLKTHNGPLAELKKSSSQVNEKLKKNQSFPATSIERQPPRLPGFLSFSNRFRNEWRMVLANASKNLTEIWADELDQQIQDLGDIYNTEIAEAQERLRQEIAPPERDEAIALLQLLLEKDRQPPRKSSTTKRRGAKKV